MAHKGTEAEIMVSVCEHEIAVADIYRDFIEQESTATGTVVMHHGRVKYPGRVVADFRVVELLSLVENPVDGLRLIGAKAAFDHHLQRVLISHRLGLVERGGDVLLVICSALSRDAAFAGCAAIVDQIKLEELICLRERG